MGETREKPILFSGPMVRAILSGAKTQTRRVVRLRDPSQTYSGFGAFGDGSDGGWPHSETEAGWMKDRCPYGTPGDRLWVREAFTVNRCRSAVLFRADPMFDTCGPGDCGWHWSPSIHMPRWASRVTLLVTDVRVERVQDISEADAIAEGVEPILVPPDGGSAPHTEGFRCLWNTINAKRGYGWDANPFVWVVGFSVAAATEAE